MARFLVVYHPKQAIVWQGDVLARAIAESLIEIGHEAEVATSTKGLDRRRHLVLMSSASAWSVCGDWDGPIHLYNVSEAYIQKELWLSDFKKSGRGRWVRPRFDWIWDYSPNNTETFQDMGFRSVYIPIGYHREFEIEGLDEAYDVGFIGKIHHESRRLAAVSRIPKKLKTSILIHQRDGRGYRKFHTQLRMRKETLRTKVYLHIHSRRAGRNFPSARIIQLGLSNRRAVVTEESCWTPDGLSSPEHYLTFPVDDWDGMIDRIKSLLSDDEARIKMARRGYEFVTTKWRMVDHIRRGLEEIGI